MLQDSLDLRAEREVRIDRVADAKGAAYGAVEGGHARSLTTVFGEVTVNRLAYPRRGKKNLHPADASLNLPEGIHSFGLAELAAVEASKGSFAEAQAAIAAATGILVGKRQVESLAASAANDFDAFYDSQPRQSPDHGDVVVISVDAKGIVMRHEALRPATAAAATTKLSGRLSKGEKTNRKRMAELGAVYRLDPKPRCAQNVPPDPDDKAAEASKVEAAVSRKMALSLRHGRTPSGHRRSALAWQERCRGTGANRGHAA